MLPPANLYSAAFSRPLQPRVPPGRPALQLLHGDAVVDVVCLGERAGETPVYLVQALILLSHVLLVGGGVLDLLRLLLLGRLVLTGAGKGTG